MSITHLQTLAIKSQSAVKYKHGPSRIMDVQQMILFIQITISLVIELVKWNEKFFIYRKQVLRKV